MRRGGESRSGSPGGVEVSVRARGRRRSGGRRIGGRAPRLALPLLLAAVPALAGCASAGHRTDALHATLFMSTAAEYRALSEQTYRGARDALAAALADTSWTGAVEQGGGAGALPPAVILDVDETVLDNSRFDARLVESGTSFSSALWDAWVEEATAPPVPGALSFAREAEARGVTLVYVTNREPHLEEATRRNLARAGFPLAADVDPVLMPGEREEWDADKASRRAFVAQRFRILLLVGDDLNDFVAARRPPEERRRLVERHAERWGRSWFLLPNPVYGSWHDTLLGFESGLSEEEGHRRRLAALSAAVRASEDPQPQEGAP